MPVLFADTKTRTSEPSARLYHRLNKQSSETRQHLSGVRTHVCVRKEFSGVEHGGYSALDDLWCGSTAVNNAVV